MKDIQETIEKVRRWGHNKGITGPSGKATVDGQMTKLLEEYMELVDGIETERDASIIDGIGDMTVVLILLCDMLGLSLGECLAAAYDEIKGRTGTMQDGVFVKDA
jgi:NTP pyrophosphatase (non-canonical NTP hydrolase)